MLFKGKAMHNLKESLISNQTGIIEHHKNRKRTKKRIKDSKESYCY